MSDDVVDLLRDEMLHAAREGRAHDEEVFGLALNEIEHLRNLLNRFGEGYLRGENERIALAAANDRLRHENRILMREAEASDPEPVSVHVHAKLDRMQVMMEKLHQLIGDGRLGS